MRYLLFLAFAKRSIKDTIPVFHFINWKRIQQEHFCQGFAGWIKGFMHKAHVVNICISLQGTCQFLTFSIGRLNLAFLFFMQVCLSHNGNTYLYCQSCTYFKFSASNPLLMKEAHAKYCCTSNHIYVFHQKHEIESLILCYPCKQIIFFTFETE